MRFTSTGAPRWLLLSDIHFRAHDLDRIQKTAQWIESLPQQHNIQRVVICGDLLSSRTNQPTHVLSACYRFLSKLIDAVPRVNILLGNHDLAHKRDYTTTALDALSIRRFAPFVELHSDISSHEWDGRRVLMLPFREDQTELTDAVSRLDPRVAADTVAFAHLAIHRAVTQRHVVRPATGDSGRPITHRGMTGPNNFAALARTFTGHFHSHQTMVQPGSRLDAARLQGSLTYLGAPLQLTWGDLHDEQRGVVLLDPDTLQHELLVNPHAVDFVTADLEKALHDAIDPDSVVGKHVMLIGELTHFKYVTARDKLLSYGARSIRSWSPMTPVLQSDERADFHGLGASVPASDHVPSERLTEERTEESTEERTEERKEEAQSAYDDQTVGSEATGPRQGTTTGEEEPEPGPQIQPLDIIQHAQEYVEALELDPSLDARRSELIHFGRRLMQVSGADAGESAPSYQEIIKTVASSPGISSTAGEPPGDAEARHVFVAQPRTLSITNFLGVQGTITIDFRELPRGLAFVVGSNGSGKSTILEAMTWCQFGRCVRGGLAVNDVVNDVSGKDCQVSLEFENGYTITRYRKHKANGNRVVVTLRGEPQTQLEKDTARSTQMAIDEVLGIDYDQFIRTVVLGHESAAGFLSSNALQRRELIESLLGLSTLDELFNLTRRMVKDVDMEIVELQSHREGLARTIQHIEGRMADLKTRRQQVQREAKAAAEAQETALEEKSEAQEERDRIVEKMLQNQVTVDQALAELGDRVDHARREVDMLKTPAQSADIRIAYDDEQSLSRNKLHDAQRRLQNLRLAGAGMKPPSSWQWRIIRVTNNKMGRLHQWLKNSTRETGSFDYKENSLMRPWYQFTRRSASVCLAVVGYVGSKLRTIEARMVETKQLAALDHLREAIATVEQELQILTGTSEQVSERVALARGVDEQQVRRIVRDMTVEEARDIKGQHSVATGRLSLLMAEYNQVMQQKMHQEYSDRDRRDELETRLAALAHNVMLLQKDMENNKRQAVTYSQLLVTEQLSIEQLRYQQAARDAQAERLASWRELFAFWESASSRRHTSTATFRAYVLGKRLDELNGLLSQILTVLYDDTRHVRGMTSGMLRSLFQDGDGQQEGAEDQDAQAAGVQGGTGGVVLDKTLAINSAFSYAKRSGGERKRIDLALFFALLHLSHSRSCHRARYLLVDEVFDSLDVAGQAVVVRWCRSSMSRMDFVLVITHSEHMIADGEGGEGYMRIEARMGDEGTVFDFDR